MAGGAYDAIYHHIAVTDTDPATNLDWWLSSRGSHLWHPNQKAPATAWEARIDDLMQRQSTTLDRAERRRLFGEVQRVFVAHNPVIYFVTPRIYVATSMRVAPMCRPGAPADPVGRRRVGVGKMRAWIGVGAPSGLKIRFTAR